jgi:flagella basal body P-ring formation protein FlgA
MRKRGRLTAVVILLASSAWFAQAETGTAIRLLPVPASTIPAGQVISSDDLTLRKFQTTPRSLSGVATETSEITGKEARRRLLAGRPVPLSALMKPLAVKRGSKVTASYVEDGLSISTQLLALEDGGVGDMISLRNTSTGVIVNAEILLDGGIAVTSE